MAGLLFLFLPNSEDATLRAAINRGDRLDPISLTEARRHAAEAIGIAPGPLIAHFKVSLPARSSVEAAAAALFAIEDDLAQPIEQVHVAVGPRYADDPLRDVYAVDRALIAAWIDLLRANGFADAPIIPDLAFLDGARGPLDAGTHFLNAAENRRFAVDKSLPEAAITALLGPSSATGAKPLETALLARIKDARRIDFRTGAFARREETALAGLGAWRLAAGLAVAASVAGFVGLLLEARQDADAAARLEAAAQRRFAALYPGEPPPANLAAEIQRRSSSAGHAGLEFRSASRALYEATASVSGARIRSLQFDAANSSFIARVQFPAFGDDARLNEALATRGYTARSGDARQEREGVTAEIRIEPRAS